MKVLSWNLRHGGGARIPNIAAAIVSHAPDVAILTEYRAAAGRELRSRLRDAGYAHAEEAPMAARQNGVAIISRWPLKTGESCPTPVPPHRWLERYAPEVDTSFVAFYGPLENEPFDDWWDAIRATIPLRLQKRFLLAGDFNTGMSIVDAPRNPFYCANHFEALQHLGMRDAWRSHNPSAREYSWFSVRGGRPIDGFRLDHALVTPPLAAHLTRAHYSHAERETTKVSDHSILLVEFNLPAL
jgi:exodeoxyribonuclease III